MFFKRALNTFLQDVVFACFLGRFSKNISFLDQVSLFNACLEHKCVFHRCKNNREGNTTQKPYPENIERKITSTTTLIPEIRHMKTLKKDIPKDKTPPWKKLNKKDCHEKAPEWQHNKNISHYKTAGEKNNTTQKTREKTTQRSFTREANTSAEKTHEGSFKRKSESPKHRVPTCLYSNAISLMGGILRECPKQSLNNACKNRSC